MKKENKSLKFNVTSKRLKNLNILIFVVFIWLIAIIFLLGVSLITKINLYFEFILLVFFILGDILFIILINQLDKEILFLTKGSFLYYKRSTSLYFRLLLEFSTTIIIAELIALLLNKNGFSLLMNINITLFGLVFAIYAFIVPYVNKRLELETKKYKKIKNENNKFKKQGEVYKTKLFINKIYINIFIMTAIFLISIFIVINFIPNIIVICSILYEFINIFQLVYLIKLIYHYNIRDVEEEMYKECIDAKIISKDNKKK